VNFDLCSTTVIQIFNGCGQSNFIKPYMYLQILLISTIINAPKILSQICAAYHSTKKKKKKKSSQQWMIVKVFKLVEPVKQITHSLALMGIMNFALLKPFSRH